MQHPFPVKTLIRLILLLGVLHSSARPVLAAPPSTTSSASDLWVSAQAGNDANSGTTSSTAFRTIQAAASIAGPGTTIHILPGVYRESVVPAMDGTATAPITYTAENGPGTVKIRGSVPTSSLSWSRLASNTIGLPASVNPANIYYSSLSGWGLTERPRFIVQLNSQGDVASRLMPAREPDWQVVTPWKVSEFWWLANGGSAVAECDPTTNADNQCDLSWRSYTQLTDTTSDTAPAGVAPGNLTTLGNLTGATLVAADAQHAHYYYRSTIIGHNVAAGQVTIADRADNDGTPGLGWGSKYYVENHPALLDQPGEWWFDSKTGNLYLWAPNGTNPAQLNMEISRRNTGFDLTNRSYITLNGLTIELFNQQAYAIANSNSKNKAFGNILQNCTLRYSNQGVVLYQYMNDQTPSTYAIDNFLLQGCEIAYMDTSAVDSSYWWANAPSPASFNHSGVRNTVFAGNRFHDLGFNSQDRMAVGLRFLFPDRLRFLNNQVDHTAHSGANFLWSLINSTKQWGFSPQEILLGNILVANNLFDKACLLASDCGGLKFGGSQRPDTHVFRDVLVTGNVFRNGNGWSYVSALRGKTKIGDANGFYLDQASGVHVYRNIAYNNTGAGYKLACLWRDGDSIFYNNIAANNYLYGFKLTGLDLCDNHNGSINTQLVNNILANNEAFGMQVSSAYNASNFGNLVINYNLYYKNGWNSEALLGGSPANIQLFQDGQNGQYFHNLSEIQAGTPWEDHGVEGTPSFANYDPADHNRYDDSWPDFHLTAASINAIDHGTTDLPSSLSALLTMFGMADARQGTAYDIGRFESNFAAATCNTNVFIGPILAGCHFVPTHGSIRQRYTGVNSGPVAVESADGVAPIIASERVSTFSGSVVTGFSELLGLPTNQLSSSYLLPWYNNVDLDTQLRFGNLGGASTTVTVRIGGVVRGTYTLAPSQSTRVSFPVNDGPVAISSSGGVPIVAAERTLFATSGGGRSFAELMGLPQAQVSTSYAMPWYNNTDFDTQLRFGNVGAVATTVTVRIGGVVRGTYTLAPSQSTRVSFPVNDGPVAISSSGGVPIVASERFIYSPDGGASRYSFAELMGLPQGSLSEEYWLPVYDNLSQDDQLRFGNLGTSSTTVTVRVGGVVRGTYTLTPSQSLRVGYPGLNGGPVQVTSSGGVPIIVSHRVLCRPYGGSPWLCFGETMGLPTGQLGTAYAMPWYNNVDLRTEIAVGKP